MLELGDFVLPINGRCDRRRWRRLIERGTLEIGRHCCAASDALAFCFDVVAEGTPAQGATLDIRKVDGDQLTVRTLEIEEAD